jgi:hypothetical protein
MRFWLLIVLAMTFASVTGCSEESATGPNPPSDAVAQKSDPPPPPPPLPPPSPASEATPPASPTSDKASSPPPKTLTAIERPAASDGEDSESKEESKEEAKETPKTLSAPESKPNNAAGGKSLTLTLGKSESKPRSIPIGGGPTSTSSKDQKSNDAEPIRLSLGVSLPQTGPEGTLMSFSVDYEMQIEPSNATYVWVIEREQGKPAKIQRSLTKKKDRLIALVPGWRPEEGPFQAHLEDKHGKRLSNNAVLLSAGE